jgi:hypothetical protein
MHVSDQHLIRFDLRPMQARTVGMNGFDSRLEKGGNAPIKNTRWHARYPKRVAEYARIFCRSEDTIKAWIKRGKQSGWLPPLEHGGQDFVAWYAQHIDPCPDDLVALCGCVPASAAGAAGSSNGSNGEKPLDLQQAVLEVRRVLAGELAALNRANISDARRGILLRNVQRTSDSLVRLETASANIRREDRDVLSWGEFAATIADAVGFLIETRKSFPHRIMASLETLYADPQRRHLRRVAQMMKEAIMEAAEKACKDDVRILITAPELHPVIEKIQDRFRELEAAALQDYREGKTPIALTFEPIETTSQT